MNASRLLLVAAAALATAAAPAFADEADGSQYGMQFTGTQTRAEVQADLTQYRQAAVNPWAMQYNPLATFQGERTRAQVRGEYLANRDAVHALTGEDSGSAYLTGGEPSARANRLAGQPLRIVQ
jgi:hypothetical protein